MAFQSEKQRRYLHANHPEIANRWEAKYGLGGIAELNSQLNQLPEYYLPKNQGGFIPSHEAGIYGLAEGGRTGLYQGGGPHGGSSKSSQNKSPGHPGNQSNQPSRTTTTTTTTGDGPDPHGDQGTTEEHLNKIQQTELKNFVNQQEKDWGKYDNPLDKYSHTPQGTINRENFKQKQALDNWNQVKDTANTWAKKKAGKAVVDHFLLGGATFGLSDIIGGLIQGFKTNKAKNEFIDVIKGSIAEYEKLGLAEQHHSQDTLIQDLNQQLLDLTQTRSTPEDGGPDGPTAVASITYDDIEDTNRKEMASTDQLQVQKEVDRSKQMAYWRMMMAPYMSAQGGRVPGGYNTGGLSNLFRLKNRQEKKHEK